MFKNKNIVIGKEKIPFKITIFAASILPPLFKKLKKGEVWAPYGMGSVLDVETCCRSAEITISKPLLFVVDTQSNGTFLFKRFR